MTVLLTFEKACAKGGNRVFALLKKVSADMSMDVIIWGASGHAKVVADILRKTGYAIAGFIDELHPERRGESFFGSTVLGGREQAEALLACGVRRAIVGFGDNERRLETGLWLQSRGFEWVTAIHPTAIIAEGVPIGTGTVICAAATICAGASIGIGAIINTQADVDHDCVVEDGAHLSAGVILAGGSSVARCAFLGIGSMVIEKRRVGANSLVGAGAVVLKDVPEGVIVVGVPARVIKEVQK